MPKNIKNFKKKVIKKWTVNLRAFFIQPKNELIKGKNELMNLLKDYLPLNVTNIVSTFMFISK